MSTDTHVCSGCGAQSYKYWHRVTPGIVETLIKFKRAVIAKGENSVHTRKDMDGTVNELSKGQYANWTMLRYHGLVAKDDDAARGYWLLTRRGNAFLRGEQSIPQRVQVMNNRVLHDHGEVIPYVSVEDVMGSRPYFESIDEIEREAVPLDFAQKRLAL